MPPIIRRLVLFVVWPLGTVLFICFWPNITYHFIKKAFLVKGFGEGPIPVNTLYTEPQKLFEDPLSVALPASSSKLITTGVNRDTLLVGGWLDLSKGPLVLHVPDMESRYYSVQFTDPSNGTDFAYVGTRATGAKAGDYLINGPGWKGIVPKGMTGISSPGDEMLLIGRVMVKSDSDLPAAYGLSKQIQLRPFQSVQ